MLVTETLRYKWLGRLAGLAGVFHAELPPAAQEELAKVRSALAVAAGLTGNKASLAGRARELQRLKNLARNRLREDCAALHRIAKAVAVDVPGFDGKFRMPVLGDEKLLATGRAFLEDAAPVSAVFLEHALPEDFLDALKTSVQRFEKASKNCIDGTQACRAVDSAITATMRKAIASARRLDAIVRNTFRQDVEKLDRWNRASEFGKSKPKAKAKPANRRAASQSAISAGMIPRLVRRSNERYSGCVSFDSSGVASRKSRGVLFEAAGVQG